MDDEREMALRVLLDKDEIHSAMMRYCRGVDRCDEELMRSIFHPDGRAFATSAWEFVHEFIPANRAETSFTVHFIGNFNIDVREDEAFSEAYFVTYAGRMTDAGEVVDAFCGRYIDRWERRDGSWGIVLREVAREWARADAFGSREFPIPPSEAGTFIQPVRDRTDWSYQRGPRVTNGRG